MISLKNRLIIISVILCINVKYSSSENNQCETDIKKYLTNESVVQNYIHAFEHLSINFILKSSKPEHLEAYFKELEDMVSCKGVLGALGPAGWCDEYKKDVAKEICLAALIGFNFKTSDQVLANSVEVFQKSTITASSANKELYTNWRIEDLTTEKLFPGESGSNNTVNKVGDSKTNSGGSSKTKKDDGSKILSTKLGLAIDYFNYHLGWVITAEEVEDKKKVKTIEQFCNGRSTAAEMAPVF